MLERLGSRQLAREQLLDPLEPQRNRRHAPDCHASERDPAVGDRHARKRLGERPLGLGTAGGPEIGGSLAGERSRHLHRGQDLVLTELVVAAAVRAIAVDLGHAACGGAGDLHLSLVGEQGHAEGGGVWRHARTEVEAHMQEVVARARRAIRSLLLEAGDVRVAVVPAAVALQQVPTEGAGRTDLRRCERRGRLREAGVGLREPGVGRQHGNRGKGADPGRAPFVPLQPVEPAQQGQVYRWPGAHPATQTLLEVSAAGAVLALGPNGFLDCHRSGAHGPIPSSSRSGRIGSSYGRQPVALCTALPIEAATAMVESSPSPTPPPGTCSNPSSSKWTSISGTSPIPGTR
jgi:hypothetical protein